MKIGIGLPNTLVPELSRGLLLDWAREAENAGFHSLGTIDQPGYDSWDPLVALSAAAAVTERIRLATTILQLPNRNEVQVAKQVATIDQLSNGRVDLGVAVGGRPSDYQALGVSMKGQGARFEAQLERMTELWEAARQSSRTVRTIGPAPVQTPRPPIWIGAMAEKTVARAIRMGDGFIYGTVGPQMMADMTPGIRAGAAAAGKPNYRIVGLAYAGIGDNTQAALDEAAHAVLRYYDNQLWAPPDQLIHHGPPSAIAEALAQYQASGIDELIMFCEIPDLKQIELLAKARDLAHLSE